MATEKSKHVDKNLLDATEAALSDSSWQGLTLELIADKAGVSRVTLWRKGVSKERLEGALLDRLIGEYRAALWPSLTTEGNGLEKLRKALDALWGVCDNHLDLLRTHHGIFGRALVHSIDERAQRGRGEAFDAREPFTHIIKEGLKDGTLHSGFSPSDASLILFDVACWAYIHLRTEYRYKPDWARKAVLELVLHGLEK